ncbi:MAG TPA: PAS domain S-box protein, partial [Verrucomicrobiae bacterium]|nr:PAS domain S-box protein [Verrucomicrobiae bacterium]
DAAGVPMLAGVEAVAGTPWLLMARTNVTDVFASWRSRARVLLVLVLALLITVGSIVFAAWQRSLQEHYRELLKMEGELRQTQERFQLLAESSAVGIYLIRDGRFEYVNPAFAAIFGYEIAEIAGRLAVAEIVHPEHRVRVAYNLQHHLVEKNGPKHYEFRGKRKDGTEILLEAHDRYLEYGGRPGVIGSLADITQRKQLEAELQRSQRMESLGALASGIAHDLNNALTPVIIGAELLRPGQDQRGLQLLDTISSSARRGTEMVKQIVSFARGRRGETGPVLMQVLVREMAKILESTFPKSITIHSRLPNDLWRVQGDPTELHQVLLNLSVNARDAMPEGGELTLAAENVELKPGDLPANPGAGAGPYLKISVTDTGVGISAELLPRVFEPFFTTKAADKGTGLGLYTVSNIVKNHRGFLRIDSEVGKGTCFNLYLPAAQMAAKEAAPEPSRRPLPAGNGELIMVMDDEQAVRQLVRSSLESYGYRVLTVPNGLLGITCFEQNREQIKAIVSDTDMPFTDGLSALRTIQKSKPGIPIIIASGTKRSLESVDASHLTVLYKPYTVEELLLAVARSLRGD